MKGRKLVRVKSEAFIKLLILAQKNKKREEKRGEMR